MGQASAWGPQAQPQVLAEHAWRSNGGVLGHSRAPMLHGYGSQPLWNGQPQHAAIGGGYGPGGASAYCGGAPYQGAAWPPCSAGYGLRPCQRLALMPHPQQPPWGPHTGLGARQGGEPCLSAQRVVRRAAASGSSAAGPQAAPPQAAAPTGHRARARLRARQLAAVSNPDPNPGPVPAPNPAQAVPQAEDAQVASLAGYHWPVEEQGAPQGTGTSRPDPYPGPGPAPDPAPAAPEAEEAQVYGPQPFQASHYPWTPSLLAARVEEVREGRALPEPEVKPPRRSVYVNAPEFAQAVALQRLIAVTQRACMPPPDATGWFDS